MSEGRELQFTERLVNFSQDPDDCVCDRKTPHTCTYSVVVVLGTDSASGPKVSLTGDSGDCQPNAALSVNR